MQAGDGIQLVVLLVVGAVVEDVLDGAGVLDEDEVDEDFDDVYDDYDDEDGDFEPDENDAACAD